MNCSYGRGALRRRPVQRSRTCRRRLRPSWMNCDPRWLPHPIIRLKASAVRTKMQRRQNTGGGKQSGGRPSSRLAHQMWKFGLADFHSQRPSDLWPVCDPIPVGFDARWYLVGLTVKLVEFGRHAGWSAASQKKKTVAYVRTVAGLCLPCLGSVGRMGLAQVGWFRVPALRDVSKLLVCFIFGFALL